MVSFFFFKNYKTGITFNSYIVEKRDYYERTVPRWEWNEGARNRDRRREGDGLELF